MAVLGKWSGGTVAISPTTSWAAPASLFPTEDRNDSSSYTFTASTSTLTLPSSGLADGYLVVGAYEYEDTSNGRHNPEARFTLASGTGTFVSGHSTGYNRDNSEDRSYVRTWAFVDGPSASATIQFQWRRDSDAPTGGTVRSEFQVIPLYYSDFAGYTSTSSSTYGGTTPNQVTGWSGTDGTNITLASNQFTITGDNKKYLFLGSWYLQGAGNRTQRWGGLYTASALLDHAKSYGYMRNSANDRGGDLFTHLHETATADETYEVRIYRGDGVSNGQGGADTDQSFNTGEHALVILELNDSAEGFATQDATGGQQWALTGPVDINVSRTSDIAFNDSASWTRASDTAMNAVQTGDVLLGANVSAASYNVGSASRWTAFSEFTVNGTEDSDSFAGDYLRGNQGSIDTFGWSANLLGFQAATAGDDFGVSVTELPGSEGGGGNVQSPAGWVGFWGLNLDTLESGGAAEYDLTANESSAAASDDEPALTAVYPLTANASIAAVSDDEPALTASYPLTAQESAAAASDDEPGLTAAYPLTAAESGAAVSDDEPSLGYSPPGAVNLTAVGSAAAVSDDEPTLTFTAEAPEAEPAQEIDGGTARKYDKAAKEAVRRHRASKDELRSAVRKALHGEEVAAPKAEAVAPVVASKKPQVAAVLAQANAEASARRIEKELRRQAYEMARAKGAEIQADRVRTRRRREEELLLLVA